MRINISEQAEKKLLTAMGWVFRLLLGALFTYSGFVKAIDPYGTIYKMGDYLGAMGISLLPSLMLVGVFILCGYEFLVGVFFLTGSYRRATPVMAALLMAFMLPLTLWVAAADPVADCGCFGDAWVISNWATFWKNILITAMLVWIWTRNKDLHWLVTPALQWIGFVLTGVFIVAIEWIGYFYQPLIDFRNYPIGETLIANAAEGDDNDEAEFIFVYEKNGQRREFTTENLPDESEGWEFVERKEVSSPASENSDGAESKDIRFFSVDGNEDLTAEAFAEEGPQLILFMPQLDDVPIAQSYKINSLYDWSLSHGVDMICVANGSEEEFDAWKDVSMASYPIYLADDTSIEEVVRGNPGIVYLEDGKVMWKSSLQSIFVDDFMEGTPMTDANSLARDNGLILSRLSWTYLILLLLLITFSFLPKIAQKKNKEKE